jgi:hypothetical protein
MGLNHWAQKQVDEQIQQYWSAFKHGSLSCGEEAPSKVDFKAWLEAAHPTIAIYYDPEKLK